MKIHIDSHTRGGLRTMTITLEGDDMDYINLTDSGDGMNGPAGNLIAQITEVAGLVQTRADDRMRAARLARQAAEIMERSTS